MTVLARSHRLGYDLDMAPNIFDTEATWISQHSLPIVSVLILAIISEFIGERLIIAAIRRIVHGHHIGRPNQSAIDVKKRQDTIISITTIVWKLVVLLGVAFALIGIIFPQVNLLPLLASAGVLGAVIGFGAQSIIKDFISGIFIIAENQFRIGDEVEIDGASGKVEHISIRSTVIRDDAGNVHYIANGNVLHTINKTMGYSKVYFTLAVDPDTDIDKLAEIIGEVGEKMKQSEKWQHKLLEVPKLFNLGAFSDNALEVRVSAKTQPGDQFAITTEFKKRLLTELKKHDDVKLSQYLDLTTLAKKK